MWVLYVITHFLCELSSCLISKLRESRHLGPLAFFQYLAQGWFSSNRTASLSSSKDSRLWENWKIEVTMFLSKPKMADMRDAILCFLVLFWGQNPSFVFNQRQLVAAIFAGICVCVPRCEKQQSAYTGIAHWNELSFWQKRKQIPGTESSSFFFFFFRSHARVSGSQWVFVGLSHISAVTFWCLF